MRPTHPLTRPHRRTQTTPLLLLLACVACAPSVTAKSLRVVPGTALCRGQTATISYEVRGSPVITIKPADSLVAGVQVLQLTVAAEKGGKRSGAQPITLSVLPAAVDTDVLFTMKLEGAFIVSETNLSVANWPPNLLIDRLTSSREVEVTHAGRPVKLLAGQPNTELAGLPLSGPWVIRMQATPAEQSGQEPFPRHFAVKAALTCRPSSPGQP